ncbi:MAG: hypothetical protein HY290_23400 [Planctomycetia bacterium]|nr:hypothetical protein [Planctomycetia bacterium]
MPELFPLTLAPLEEFLLADDQPFYRKTFALDLDFAGEIDRGAFEAGLRVALSRHPLLTARLERRRWGLSRWTQSGTVEPQVIWQDADQAIQVGEDEAINLDVEAGVRFHVQVGAGQSRMLVFVHHACCDGIGAIQFLSDLFTGYAHCADGNGCDVQGLTPLEPERLRQRGRFPIRIPAGVTIGNFFRRAVEIGIRLLFRPATTLAAPVPTGAEVRRSTLAGSLTRTLDARVLLDLRRLARRRRVTVNDLLIRELFFVLRDWNLRHAPHAPVGRLSQMIPLSMRNLNHDRVPATNVMTGWYCSRDASELANPEALLQSIHDEGVFLRASGLPALLPMTLGLLRRIPGLVPWLSRRPSKFSTVVLSNVGDPWRAAWGDFPTTTAGEPIFGNIVLREANSASPLPAGNRAAFTVWHASDRMRVAVRCDRQLFSLADAETLLDLFTGRIAALANSGIEERRAAA